MTRKQSQKPAPRASKRRKDKPVTAEIARAAERIGYGDPARLERIKAFRAASGCTLAEAVKAIDALDAHEPTIDASELARLRQVRAVVSDRLRLASDMVAEELAAVQDPAHTAGDSEDFLTNLHYRLWQLRWELGVFVQGGDEDEGDEPAKVAS